MSFLIKDKNFYKVLFSITLPIAAQNFITFTVSLADSLMLGKVGEIALSGANLANQLFFILMIVTFGVTSAAMVFASQYWGKDDIYSMKRVITIMLRLAAFISIVASALAICIPETVMSWYSDDLEVIEAGASYLRIIGWAYPFYSITNAMASVLRSAHVVKISIVIYLSSLIVNVSLNWVLIFGNLGAPELGIRGAAIATAVARVVEFIILLIYLAFFEKKIHYTFRDLFVPVKDYLGAFLKTGAPVVLNEAIWSIGTSVLSMIIGHISTEFVSANSIANIIWQCVWVVVSGMGNATSVVIGNSIGRGENKEIILNKAKTIVLISAIMGVISAFLLMIIRGPVINFYEVSAETKALAYDLIVSYAIIIVFQSMSVQYVVGIFRGGGDTKTAMFVDVFFLWTVAIPLGAIVGLVLGWAPPLVYIMLRSDEFLKNIMSFIRLRSGKWIRDITVHPIEEK
ncbi:MAG: MATE family efflux transporter [Oscillospiraceae bacterium]|nr:MATE family efflux transporter [Oscillospiraceae bacterium]MBR6657376.1 MATE family efflux transporter [Oscillospiraceae bacterium]